MALCAPASCLKGVVCLGADSQPKLWRGECFRVLAKSAVMTKHVIETCPGLDRIGSTPTWSHIGKNPPPQPLLPHPTPILSVEICILGRAQHLRALAWSLLTCRAKSRFVLVVVCGGPCLFVSVSVGVCVYRPRFCGDLGWRSRQRARRGMCAKACPCFDQLATVHGARASWGPFAQQLLGTALWWQSRRLRNRCACVCVCVPLDLRRSPV